MTNARAPRTEEEQLAFYEGTHAAFLRAVERVGQVDRHYRVAGETIRLSFAGERLLPWYTPALAHLAAPAVTAPALTICLWDSESTGIEMLPPPCKRQCFSGRGDLWGFNSRRIRLAFQDYSVHALDHRDNTAVSWVARAGSLPYWVTASPLRTILHWWVETLGGQLVHGAAVGIDGAAVLAVGPGGIGKSTTALACLEAGMHFLGDDYVAVRLGARPTVSSLYCTAKLDAAQLRRFPALVPLVVNRQRAEHEKAVLLLHPELAAQIRAELPLAGIVTPRIADREDSAIRPEPSRAVQQAAAFTTISQLPHASHRTQDFFARLYAAVPGVTLDLGRDLARIPETLTRFIRTGATSPRPRMAAPPRPLVSVVIPVFNGARFIGDAVEAVVGQGYPSTEIIVVDDGSTDDTGAVVRALPHPVSYVAQPNAGPAAARNRGIEAARGDVLAFLDVDDLWPAGTLEALVDELVDDPLLDLVQGHAQNMERDPASGAYEYRGSPTESFPYSITSAVYRRRAFERVGLFDATLRYGEDMDWFRRARELAIPMRRLERTTLLVRLHDDNMTRDLTPVELGLFEVLRRAVGRKTGGPPKDSR